MIIHDTNVIELSAQDDFLNYRSYLQPASVCDHVKLIFRPGLFTIERAEMMNFEGYSKVELIGPRANFKVAGDSSFYHFPATIRIKPNFSHIYNSDNMTDDAVIRIISQKEVGLEVNISDIVFKTDISQSSVISGAENFNVALNTEEFKFIKILNAASVNIWNVNSTVGLVKMSNIMLRRCENVKIHNCVIKNFTCRNKGTNIEFQQKCKNVEITNCDFYKYSNDECLWFCAQNTLGQKWNADSSNYHYDVDELEMNDRIFPVDNVLVANNRFFYTNKDQRRTYHLINIASDNNGQPIAGFTQETIAREGVWSGFNDVFNTFSVAQDGKERHTSGAYDETYCRQGYLTIRNIKFAHNEINISAPLYSVLTFAGDDTTILDGVEITDNIIRWKSWQGLTLPPEGANSIIVANFKFYFDTNYNIIADEENPYITEMEKYCYNPILIKGNAVYSERKYDDIAFEENTCVSNEGANILMVDNEFHYKDSICGNTDSEKQAGYGRRGFVVMRTERKGGKLEMRNNVFEELMNLVVATTNDTETTIPQVIVSAYDNTFVGDTRSNLLRVENASLDFKRNKFYSYYYYLFLYYFAQKGSVCFEDNVIKKYIVGDRSSSTNGILYGYYVPTEITPPIYVPSDISMRFYSAGNVISNITQNDVYTNLSGQSNIMLLKMGNKYSDTTD